MLWSSDPVASVELIWCEPLAIHWGSYSSFMLRPVRPPGGSGTSDSALGITPGSPALSLPVFALHLPAPSDKPLGA